MPDHLGSRWRHAAEIRHSRLGSSCARCARPSRQNKDSPTAVCIRDLPRDPTAPGSPPAGSATVHPAFRPARPPQIPFHRKASLAPLQFERRTGEEADEAAIPVDHHFAEGRVVSTEQNRRAANFNRNLVLLIQPFTCSPFSGGTAVALLSYQAATRRPRPRMPAALPALKGSNGKATRQ